MIFLACLLLFVWVGVVVCFYWCVVVVIWCCCYVSYMIRCCVCFCGSDPFGGFVVLFVLDVVTCSGFVASVLLCLVLNLKLISLFPLL